MSRSSTMLATRTPPENIPSCRGNDREAALDGAGFLAMWQRQHRRWRLDAEAFADGELAPDRRGPVQRHLTMCWPCSEDLEMLRMMKASLWRQSQRLPSMELARLRRIAERVTVTRPPPP